MRRRLSNSPSAVSARKRHAEEAWAEICYRDAKLAGQNELPNRDQVDVRKVKDGLASKLIEMDDATDSWDEICARDLRGVD